MSVIYLYGFVPEGTDLPEGGLLGVDDAAVERLDGPGIAAIVSELESADFQPDGLERNTGNVEWMAGHGLSHEQVVAWFVDHASILPARFLTLFSGRDALREAMREKSERIRAELDRFEGLREWDLRVEHDEERLMARLAEVSDDVARLDREIEEAGPGKRFLLEKRRKDLARTEGRAAARRLARELLDVLRPYAREVVTLRAPADAEPNALNAALLVERASESELGESVARERDRLEPLGLDVRLTGPWAPYRFMEEHD